MAALRLWPVAQVEPHFHCIPAQETDQLFDQPLRRGGQRLGVEFVAQVGAGVRLRADGGGVLGIVTKQQAEMTHARQRGAHQLEAAHAEIGGGDVELRLLLAGEQIVEHVGQLDRNIVDDEGYAVQAAIAAFRCVKPR